MNAEDFLDRLEKNKDLYGAKEEEEEEPRTRIRIRLRDAIHFALQQARRKLKNNMKINTGIADCYLTGVAIMEYLPNQPEYMKMKYYDNIKTYQEYQQYLQWFKNQKRVTVKGDRVNITVGRRPVGKLAQYWFPNTFLMNLSLAGLFSELEFIPEVHREECLNIFDQLNQQFDSYSEMDVVSVYDLIVDFFKEQNRKGPKLISMFEIGEWCRGKGISQQDLQRILDELIGEGRLKAEGLNLRWIG